MFLMDTDHFGIFQQQSGPECARLVVRLAARHYEDVVVPIISFHEQVMGWSSYLHQKRTPEQIIRAYRRLEAILEDFTKVNVVGYDTAASSTFDALRVQRLRVGTMDLRIASIALSRDWTVLTRNTVDFEKVPNLKIEDWTK